MFDRITSAAPSAIPLACRKSLKRQWKVKKQQQQPKAGTRAGLGSVNELLTFMLRGGILLTFLKSSALPFVEIFDTPPLLLILICQ